MDIRLLKDHEVTDAKELWGYAFEKDEPFYSWYFKDVFKAKNCMGIFFDGQLASCLQIPSYNIYINGSYYESSYVVGVITSPEYRNQGVMKSLIQKTLEEIRSRNHYISILMPFDTFFYRPYGWELCYSQLNYEVPIGVLKDYGSRQGTFKKVGWGTDIPALDKIYREYLKFHNGYIIRSKENWKVLLQDLYHYGGFTTMVLDANNEPVGYLQYLLQGDKLMVKEMAYRNQWAKQALFGFIYGHYSQIKTVQWSAPADDNTFLLLRDTIKPSPTNSISIKPFMCSRIIDVKKALEHCNYANIDADFNMKVEDQYAPWNNDTFKVVIKNGIATVNPKKSSTPDLACSINTLTQLFMGTLDIDEALRSELIGVNSKKEQLSKVFIKKNTYINEYY